MWYIICVDIIINKTIIKVNAMKSDVIKIDTKNNLLVEWKGPPVSQRARMSARWWEFGRCA